jgi:putative protease
MAAKKARKKVKKVARKKVRKVKTRKTRKVLKRKVKKVVKKVKAKKAAKKAEVIGKVTHYYDRMGVAVVEIMSVLKLGDMIRLKHGDKSFAQKAASMQVNHQPITIAKRGEEIGLKVDQVTPEGTLVLAA